MAVRLDPEDHEKAILYRLADNFSGKRVLEIGCGDGRLTRRFAADAALVDAIDPDAERIAHARQNVTPNPVTYHAVGLNEFAPADRYDIAILSWSL